MRLPLLRPLQVDQTKLLDYLLNEEHPDGRSKAAFFLALGFTRAGWHELAEALLAHGRRNDIAEEKVTVFGTKYVVDGDLETPGGKVVRVRSVWIDEKNGKPD